MAGINSLGIGSGVLTADVLDQLREADETVILKPLETKLELANQKEEASKLLSGYMTTFKQSTSTLGGQNLYLGRLATGSNDDVTVTAQDGADLTSFNITNIDKAEKDVWKSSSSFDNKSSALSTLGEGVFTVSLDGEDYEISYNSSDSLDDIRQEINDQAGSVMTASILQIGPDNYELVITANETNEAITFSDSLAQKQLNTVTLTGTAVAGNTFTWSDGTNDITVNLVDGEDEGQSGTTIAQAINNDPTLSALYTATATADGFTIEAINPSTSFTASSSGDLAPSEVVTTPADTNSLSRVLKLDNIQEAKAATFKFNGIDITRDTNSISDLVNGVSITLNQNQSDTGSANISIGQNDTAIKTEMDLLVTNFNLLASNHKDMTTYNEDEGTAGIFNSESSIKFLMRDFTRILSKTDTDGNSLLSYGLEIDRDGVMSLDSSTFNAKLAEDPKALELLFRGASEVDPIKQLNTVSLSGTAGAVDTFEWSDGTNSISINLIDGETAQESAARIATAINEDATLKALYSATAVDDSFTIEAKRAGVSFESSITLSGSQSYTKDNTTKASSHSSKIPEVVGIFQELNDKVFSYTGANKILSGFDTKLDNLKESLISEYDKQKASLDTRYETMTKKFAAYDAVINKLNNQFSALQSMIDAELDNDN